MPKGGCLPWALFYPEDYSIGASSLGFHYIFRILRENGIAVERFFKTPIPYRSVDGDTLLERFSVITASVSYELGVTSFCDWLLSANIPLLPAERVRGHFPVIGAGGALTYINPLPLSGFCDFIILGDGIDVMPNVIKCIEKYSSSGDREALWADLALLDSVLVPPVHMQNGVKLSDSLKRTVAKDMELSDNYPMHSTWISKDSVFSDTLLIEIQRGCARKCSYCTLPGSFGKMRTRSFETIKKQVDSLLSVTSIRQAGLVTPEAGDYPELDKLTDYLTSKNIGVSFASLRIDHLTKNMISVLTAGGRHSITVAPETGNDALRFSCGKKFTNDLILEKLTLASEAGINQVKLYFMIGLPGETEDDVLSISTLCRRIIDETGQNLILSVGPFVPKPATAWQDANFIDLREIREKYRIISKGARSIKKKSPKLRLTSPKEAEYEFNLAWYGFTESRSMAEYMSASGSSVPLVSIDRENTKEELKYII